jgi:hypothetical protein
MPAFGLRSTHTQSLINSSAYRRRIVGKRSKGMLDAEQDWTVDGGDGVRLLGHYSAGRAVAAPIISWALEACFLIRALMFFV